MKIKFGSYLLLICSCFFITNSFAQTQLNPYDHVYQINLKDNWAIISSAKTGNTGAQISEGNYKADSWVKASVPSTVLGALVASGKYPDIFRGLNLSKIDTGQFKVPWWYRTTFNVESLPTNAQLVIEGINYRADIWINGKEIGNSNQIVNPFTQYSIDVTKHLLEGANAIAIKVYPPKKGDPTIGFVDWNPPAPDNEMGVFRPVKILLNKGVELRHPYVFAKTIDLEKKTAQIEIEAQAFNHNTSPEKAVITVNINNGAIKLNKDVTLAPGETKISIPLNIDQAKFWWPVNMGKPNLYRLDLSVKAANELSDEVCVNFGIRKVESYVESYAGDSFTSQTDDHSAKDEDKSAKKEESYYRVFKINGEKVQLIGAGWVDSLLLNDDYARVDAQLKYVKDMGLNTIRLEGFWGTNQDIYSLCDKYGIMIMVGWSCQWEWFNYIGRPEKECRSDDPDFYGCIIADKEVKLIAGAFKDQVLWLRNHPSIAAWNFGSDMRPIKNLEQDYVDILKAYDPSRLDYILSASEKDSALDGKPSGLKMRGPYDYEPPVYWYQDTKNGGAFGFNSETGPGAQVPPIESIKRMLNKDSLWPPTNAEWKFHMGRNEFHNLVHYDAALHARYGETKDLQQYAMKAQLLNYESMRPMFEAFAAYKSGNPYKNNVPATGVIQWMLNSAWPEFYWQLYDYYLMPNGAYFGAKKANKPLHVIYNYNDGEIYLHNATLTKESGLTVLATIWDINSNRLAKQTLKTSIGPNQSIKTEHLNVPKIPSTVYFVDLQLSDSSGNLIDDNFYWLSKKPDVLDYDKTEWFYTPTKEYADFHELNNMPMSSITVSSEKLSKGSIKVTLTNTSDKISFFNQILLKSSVSGQAITPVYWQDNYISLLPHQTKSLIVNFDNENTVSPIITVQPWNSKVTFKKEGKQKTL